MLADSPHWWGLEDPNWSGDGPDAFNQPYSWGWDSPGDRADAGTELPVIGNMDWDEWYMRFRHQDDSASHVVFPDGHVEPLYYGKVLYKNIKYNY